MVIYCLRGSLCKVILVSQNEYNSPALQEPIEADLLVTTRKRKRR
jgi:hypothetical protein